MKTNIILQGDALTKLKELPDESINMCMTSPPYWALRDYGVEGQLGLESTFDEYINNLCDIFNEVKRVLKEDGTCWVNLGDTYMGNSSYSEKGRQGFGKDKIGMMNKKQWLDPKNPTESKLRAREHVKQCLQSKSLCMIPQRFAIEMCNRGWILRNNIIWHKPNAMPCSVKDRFTVDFENIFFFVKNKKYWFETQYEKTKAKVIEPRMMEEKREVYSAKYKDGQGVKRSMERNKRTVWNIKGRTTPYSIVEPEFRKEIIDFRNLPEHNKIREYLSEWKNRKEITIEQIETHFGNQAGHHWFEKDGSYPSKDDWLKLKELLGFDDTFDECMTIVFQKSGLKQNSEEGRIKRTVWQICPKPFREAHFAVYPEELCETPIKAGCPEFVCKKCGKSKVMEYKSNRNTEEEKRLAELKTSKSNSQYGTGKVLSNDQTTGMQHRDIGPNGEVGMYNKTESVGYKPTCSCNAGFTGGIVLDPFFGAGTTGLVALKQNKKFVGIELNQEYIDIANKRLKPYLEQKTLNLSLREANETK